MRKEERDRIKARRDRQNARIAELENALGLAVKELSHYEFYKTNEFDELVDSLNRIPAQSLALLKAEVLEGLANSGDFNGSAWQVGEMLIDKAAQLRKEAGE